MRNRIPALATLVCLAPLLLACDHPSWLKLPPAYGVRTLRDVEVAWAAGPAEISLPSGSAISIPAGADYALGESAKAYSLQSAGFFSEDTEAVIRIRKEAVQIDYRPAGYVADGDYCHLDLERAKAGTRSRIAQRNAEASSPAEKQAMGTWIVPPRYERRTHELTFGRLVGANDHPGANIFVVKLARRGYYLFTWSGSQQNAGGALRAGSASKQIVENTRLAPENAYERHDADDPAAGYTIAGYWDTPETAPAYASVSQDCD